MTQGIGGWNGYIWRYLCTILAIIVVLLLFLIAMGGWNFLVWHIEGKPYYTDLNAEDGYYCIDHTGWLWGYPPGYVVPYNVPEPQWFDTDTPQPMPILHLERYNQSAWISISQWPSCKEYGEV
jgi:hypothetical protein